MRLVERIPVFRGMQTSGRLTSTRSASRSANRPRWGIWLLILLCIELPALAVVGGLALYQARYAGRIYEGIQVTGIQLGGLTLDEAATAIHDGLTPYPGPAITLRSKDRTWSLAPSDLGVAVDAQATAAAAYAIGRRGALDSSNRKLPADLAVQWEALSQGYAVRPILRYDDNKLVYALKRIAAEADHPPTEPGLAISGVDVRSTPGSPGQKVELEATRSLVATLLRSGQGGTIDLIVRERPPAVTSVQEAADKANVLLSQPLILSANGLGGLQRFAVDRAVLSTWLTFTTARAADGTIDLAVQNDREQILSYLQEIALQIDRQAYDAALDFDPETGEISVLKSSLPGQRLDLEASADAIEAALAGKQREISLSVVPVPPKVDSDKTAEMGIVELVSSGTTSFKGSTAERVHNIANAAGKFRGVVIPPGEVFSFNKYVGDVTTANGFVDSLIIRGDRTEVGVGGGVCQVSTTAFRAAFLGGFPIIERYPHAYVVSWYGEPGMDATIYTPNVDFRFRNDTEHFLLVKPEVDTEKGTVTFYLYGTKPGREVEVSEPVITDVSEPDPPLYQEDPSLRKGVIKQVDWAKKGMDVEVVRTIYNADGETTEQTFVSRYHPWQAVFLYGPGTELPAGASD